MGNPGHRIRILLLSASGSISLIATLQGRTRTRTNLTRRTGRVTQSAYTTTRIATSNHSGYRTLSGLSLRQLSLLLSITRR